MSVYELLQAINDNVIDLQSECSKISGEMVGMRDGQSQCRDFCKQLDKRMRKIENTMLPIGTIITAIIIYVIITAVGA